MLSEFDVLQWPWVMTRKEGFSLITWPSLPSTPSTPPRDRCSSSPSNLWPSLLSTLLQRGARSLPSSMERWGLSDSVSRCFLGYSHKWNDLKPVRVEGCWELLTFMLYKVPLALWARRSENLRSALSQCTCECQQPWKRQFSIPTLPVSFSPV